MSGQYWWKEEQPHLVVSELLNDIDTRQESRMRNNYINLRLYGNMDSHDNVYGNFFRTPHSSGKSDRLTLNVIRAIIDTADAKMSKNEPLPTFLTDGGDWSEQRNAEKLNKFIKGLFSYAEVWKVGRQAKRDSMIFGTGVIKVLEGLDNKGRPCVQVERVLPSEIVVDTQDGIYGNPRQMHHVKFIHRDVLKQMFPGKEKEIDDAEDCVVSDVAFGTGKKVANMVRVAESWHLPSGPNAKDGKRVITISSATMLNEAWNHDYFPFAFLRWSSPVLGFYGTGIAEELKGIQVEINKTLKTLQTSMHLTAIPKVFVEAGSKVIKQTLNNEIGGIVTYTGDKPDWQSVAAVPPELVNHINFLYNKAFELSGVSQLSATSRKPSGLDAAVALREFNDIESDRFMTYGKAYEQFYIDVAELLIATMKSVQSKGGVTTVKVPGSKFVETIDWKDLDFSEEKYIMSVFPVSSLPQSPQGRIQWIQEMLQAGLIDAKTGRRLLNFPDVDAEMEMEDSYQEDILYTLDMIVDNGEYLPPEPLQDLEYGIRRFQQAYLKYRQIGLDEDKMELIRTWIVQANEILNPVAQPTTLPGEGEAPVIPAEAPVEPIAESEAPPVSELLPV